MNALIKRIFFSLSLAAVPFQTLLSQNQTETLSPVYDESTLPFSLEIEQASFVLPTGIQAYANALYKGKWILLAGRINGLHGFSDIGNNFPPKFQNTNIYIVDPITGYTIGRSLTDPSSGLTQEEIDSLSVTAPQSFQRKSTLYVVGGYGINTATGEMETKSTLTEINLHKLVAWVEEGKLTFKEAIRQVSHPLLRVTGGALFQNSDDDPFLLMVGQDFAGLYRGNSNGIYTQQIRPFQLYNEEGRLAIFFDASPVTYPDYRRRDLNISPVFFNNKPGYTIFGGVFTLDTGVWTVPINVDPKGNSFEPNPNSSSTFKQAMNHYNCATFALYSSLTNSMFVVFPGGISYGFFSNGTFTTDSEIPFINQVTTIKIDALQNYTQHLMNNQYPLIPSKGANPGNPLLFGAEAVFFPADDIPLYKNTVIKLDKLPPHPVILGYIVGGIMSTLPNTNTSNDSTSSPYVFTVKLIPKL